MTTDPLSHKEQARHALAVAARHARTPNGQPGGVGNAATWAMIGVAEAILHLADVTEAK